MSNYKVSAAWKGATDGQGLVQSSQLEAPFSIPASMKGTGVGTNPEELLLSAAASCYLITLTFVLAREQIAYDKLEVVTEGKAVFEKTFRLTHLTHQPYVHLTHPSAETEARLPAIFARAEEVCLVSNALRGNVEMHIKSHHEV